MHPCAQKSIASNSKHNDQMHAVLAQKLNACYPKNKSIQLSNHPEEFEDNDWDSLVSNNPMIHYI